MPPRLAPFHAMTIGRRAFQLQHEGRSIIHMEYGQPSAPPPQSVRDAAAKMLGDHVPGYWQSEALGAGIAETYKELYGAEVSPERIFLTCGASPALVLALLSRFEAGARIAMARPGYVAHRNTVLGLHMQPVELRVGPTEGFQLTAERLAALDPAPDGLILASPANPTGSIIPAPELEKIVAVCRERNIGIISDEIYARLSYGAPAASVTQFTDEASVINSFSKFYLMPGWRLGWLVAPEDVAPTAHAYLSNLFLTPPSLSQVAGLAALAETQALEAEVAVYARNRARLLEALPQMGLGEIAPPDGAFYIYARTDHLAPDSRALCLNLLEETGVATASGVDFDPEEGHRYMRFSFAVTEEEVEEALRRVGRFFQASVIM